MGESDYLPLFETRVAKGRLLYWLYALSMLIGIALICVYRVKHFPPNEELKTWAWTGLFMAELWYISYWLVTQFVRFNPVYRSTFKDRLSNRYEEVLPGIDIFVCTADAELEPTVMVINTVLSLMAYDYPPEKLNVYLSDDGGSELMFYALLEATRFSKLWLPFCRKFNIEPPAPSVYLSSIVKMHDIDVSLAKERQYIKKQYEEMNERINENMKLGRIPDELRKQHKGFREWESNASRSDHQTILQVLIDGRDLNAVDTEGKPLPTLVYLAREKRPGYHHNFKAGAMNALIRVSSRISNSPIILNVDCDQYSNNSESVRDALCFFMDDEQSHDIAYVQYPQYFDNMTKNDLYGNYFRVVNEVELPGIDANGGPLYIGSGCFQRRDTLCGKKYERESTITWKKDNGIRVKESANLLEETGKILAGCSYEENSPWGKEMGLKYGCPVEDVITGFSIKCRGWRSICFSPKKRAFLGVAPTTLLQSLIQHTRWSEGQFQIFLSKYCPFIYGYGKIPLKLQISYFVYNLWAANCVATLFYIVIPSFCLLKGIILFPQLSSPWVLPFTYVFTVKYAYSLYEFLWCGGTLKGWYNDQRMWLYKRVTSYLYGFFGTIMRSLGFAKLNFVITSKIADYDVSRRYEQDIMEFGADSSMFIIIATIGLFNLFTFIWISERVIINRQSVDLDSYALQIILNGLLVIINIPVFQGLFLRKDKGCIPSSVTIESLIFAVTVYLLALY
ncbi:hypothetical protein RD792_007590 [Penstemon davidsonii]|uniref:Cellulose synthase-like protein E1 n=1 Tax=Penstemon davidsonii TaxID=160366 RepID=A0ABR0D6V0_9LAMI|nr:hypothetical protein RD792_007590 [Penstemon davidsonii]